ncbi:MAG: ABC transporter substrate-binding protein, partial [Anaerolineae bacterium]
MVRKRSLVILTSLVVAGTLLSACAQPAPEVIEKTVVITKEVVKEGETVIETAVVTATPEPEPTEAPLAQISPDLKDEDTYMVVTGAGEQETLDPAWTYETAGSGVENNIYESLIWFKKGKTEEFVPVLATDWTVNEAGDVWTFAILQGVTFHEGGTLEPDDVAYSLRRALLQDRTDGPHWMTLEAFFGLYSIKDLATSLSGVESFEDVPDADLVETCELVKEAISADDEAGTVTYELNRATPWFLAMLTNSFMGAVVDKEWMVENGAWDGDCATWTQWHDSAPEDTILFDRTNGTGPYMLDHWTPGEETVLVANDDYWREEPPWESGPSGPPRIKRVVIKNVSEWGTRLAMFEAGDADWIYVPEQYRPQLEPYFKTICHP